MNKNLISLIGPLFALTLLASACGDSGQAGSQDQEVIDAVAAQIRSDDDMPVEVDANCVASAMVAGMGGAQAMEENYGLTAETIADGQDPDDVELSVDAARGLDDEALECGLNSLIVGEMAGDGISAEDASCLIDNLDQDALRDLFAAEFVGASDADRIGEAAEEAMFASVFSAITECAIDPTALDG